MVSEDILNRARHYCAYQDRCHSEVRRKLLDLSLRGMAVEEALSILIQENFLNEERFARSFCRGKFTNNHWGRVKIKNRLQQKQVSDYCIKKGLSKIDEDQYRAVFNRIFDKKKEALQGEKNHWKRDKKLRDYMIRKGFESQMVYEKLKG